MMSNYINAEIRRIVATRANNVCEYCLIAEEDAYFRFQVEHIISRKHDGSSELDNLALACVYCNRHKGSDIASLKPNTDELIRFYNPRKDKWREHFLLNETFIESLTEIGEATTRILQMNNDEQMLERDILIRQKRYLSDSAILLTTEH
ncbi:MAG: HNH endonuclease [Pyrinomonadaceae bacterium]|nr:HNH endonuclease [Pyrinomonadaceae bacterium]